VVKKAWEIRCPASDPMEIWQFKIRLLKRRIKGWSRNIETDVKDRRRRSEGVNESQSKFFKGT
jgi:hypothetical protein